MVMICPKALQRHAAHIHVTSPGMTLPCLCAFDIPQTQAGSAPDAATVRNVIQPGMGRRDTQVRACLDRLS
jgi:hypothetical protein